MNSGRPPLDVTALTEALAQPWSQVRVVETATSTNDELLAAAASAPHGAVLACEHQSAGHGRLERRWESVPRAGLTFSVLLRPGVPRNTWGWLPLMAGVAVADAVRARGVAAMVKWPNDVLIGTDARKVAGVLTQISADGAVIVGVGLNVTTSQAELPTPQSASLLTAGVMDGAALDRTALLTDVLGGLGQRYLDWSGAAGDAETCGLLPEYVALCATVGQQVRVSRLGEGVEPYRGVAAGVDPHGRLRLRVNIPPGGEIVVDSGDVEHVRASEESQQ